MLRSWNCILHLTSKSILHIVSTLTYYLRLLFISVKIAQYISLYMFFLSIYQRLNQLLYVGLCCRVIDYACGNYAQNKCIFIKRIWIYILQSWVNIMKFYGMKRASNGWTMASHKHCDINWRLNRFAEQRPGFKSEVIRLAVLTHKMARFVLYSMFWVASRTYSSWPFLTLHVTEWRKLTCSLRFWRTDIQTNTWTDRPIEWLTDWLTN